MARKQATEKEAVETGEPKAKPVRLDLSAEVHRLLRLVAADANESMASYARTAIEEHLRAEAKRRGLKG